MPLWIGQSVDEQGRLVETPIVFEDAKEAKRWLAARPNRRIWNAYARDRQEPPPHEPPEPRRN